MPDPTSSRDDDSCEPATAHPPNAAPRSDPPLVWPRMSTTPSSVSPASPFAALFDALGQVPREQLLGVIGGLRSLFGAQGPTYRSAPAPRSTGAGPGAEHSHGPLLNAPPKNLILLTINLRGEP